MMIKSQKVTTDNGRVLQGHQELADETKYIRTLKNYVLEHKTVKRTKCLYILLQMCIRDSPYSLRNGSMVMAKKIVFEIIADSDSTTLKT